MKQIERLLQCLPVWLKHRVLPVCRLPLVAIEVEIGNKMVALVYEVEV